MTSVDKAKFIVLPFTFSRELNLWSFHLVVVAREVPKKLTEKRDARAEFLFSYFPVVDVLVAFAVVAL